MEQLNNLDVVFLVIVGVSALVAIARGVTKELLSITGWILAAVSVYYLLPVVDPIMKKYIASEVLSSLVSGMVILIMFCIFWVLAADKISTQIRFSKLSSLDRILGFIFGIFRGVIIVILLQIMISSLIPEESQKGVFAESRYFKLAGDASGPIKSLIPEKWFDDLKAKGESLGFGAAKTDEAEADKAKDDAAKDDAAKDENSSESKVNAADVAGDVLKKSGEELFNKLVQPKVEGEAKAENEGYKKDETSDLDKLMDELEDKVVTTDENSAPVKNDTPKEIKKIDEKL
ncbi:MAG: CvpA family protein [Alphaproteobacteria bacterium]|nr:CvpA family protein [Alphaproteobacteria bacterium]MDY4689411.1 CvpA family protein [Alphaproteobacteria bacterium]